MLPRNPYVTTPAGYKSHKFGLFPFRSPLLGEYLRFLFLRVLKCFTSPGIAFITYEFSNESYGITRMGLPHSEIFGSKHVCCSPKRIAAYRVFHRLLTPSHPPQALRSLTLICHFSIRPLYYNEEFRLPFMKLSKIKKFSQVF